QVFERSSQRLFALAQALLRQLPLSHVSCSPKPLDDVALRIEQWNRVRERPTPATIQAAHAMLELKDALGSHRLLDDPRHGRLILGMDVLVEPAPTRISGIGKEIPPLEETHFAPVRTHLVDDFGGRADERVKPSLILVAHADQLEPGADTSQKLPCR